MGAIYIYICNHENNVPSRLSPQWLCGNQCTWAHDVRLHIAGTNKSKSAQQAKQRASKHQNIVSIDIRWVWTKFDA